MRCIASSGRRPKRLRIHRSSRSGNRASTPFPWVKTSCRAPRLQGQSPDASERRRPSQATPRVRSKPPGGPKPQRTLRAREASRQGLERPWSAPARAARGPTSAGCGVASQRKHWNAARATPDPSTPVAKALPRRVASTTRACDPGSEHAGREGPASTLRELDDSTLSVDRFVHGTQLSFVSRHVPHDLGGSRARPNDILICIYLATLSVLLFSRACAYIGVG